MMPVLREHQHRIFPSSNGSHPLAHPLSTSMTANEPDSLEQTSAAMTLDVYADLAEHDPDEMP